MPQYFNIILGLFNQVHHLLDQFVFSSYHQLTLVLRMPLALCITIYVVLLGYSVSQGWVDLSINHVVKISLKLSIIFSLAMNWDFFSHYIVDFIQQGSGQLGSVLLKSSLGFSKIDPQNGIEGALQSILNHFTKIGYWLWRRGSWHSLSPYFEAIVIWGSSLALILYATFQLIISNIMLSILFVLAPLFFIFLVFDATKNLFNRWFGHIISYALLMIFVSALLSLVLNITQWSISDITEYNLLNTLFIVSFIPIVVVCFINIFLIKYVANMAHNIGLSFSISFLRKFFYEKIY